MGNEYYRQIYLAHHGIKGQEWGVRRGPPYPLDKANGKKKNSVEDSKTSTSATGASSGASKVGGSDSKYKARSLSKGTTAYYNTYIGTITTSKPSKRQIDAGWYEEFKLPRNLRVASEKEVDDLIDAFIKNQWENNRQAFTEAERLTWYYNRVDEEERNRSKFAKDFYDRHDALGDLHAIIVQNRIEKESQERVQKGLIVAKNPYDSFWSDGGYGLQKKAKEYVIDELKKRGYNGATGLYGNDDYVLDPSSRRRLEEKPKEGAGVPSDSFEDFDFRYRKDIADVKFR